MDDNQTQQNENIIGDLVVGLDIGTTKIAAIVGYKNEFGKVVILSIGKAESLGVQRGVVANIEQTIDSINTAVKLAADKAEIDIEEVIVGIAGQHIKSMQHRGMITRKSLDEEVNQNDVDNLIDNMHRLVMNPGEEIIHVIPQEYIIDNEGGIRNPIGHSGIRLEGNFHIITNNCNWQLIGYLRRSYKNTWVIFHREIIKTVSVFHVILNSYHNRFNYFFS